jgi:hypothetical protein
MINPAFRLNPFNPSSNVNQVAHNIATLGDAMGHLPPGWWWLAARRPPSPVLAPLVGPVFPLTSSGPSPFLTSTSPGVARFSATGPGVLPGEPSPGDPFPAPLPDPGPWTPPGWDPLVNPFFDPWSFPIYSRQDVNYTFYNPSEAMRAAGEVVLSSGEFLKAEGERKKMDQEVISKQTENRRHVLEQYLWERSNMPTRSDNLARERREEGRQAIVNPGLPAILNGSAINTVLDYLGRMPTGWKGQAVPVDPDLLRRVHVRPRGETGNPALLRAR